MSLSQERERKARGRALPILVWRTASAGSAKLLMLENMVLAGAQSGVHCAPVKPTRPEGLAGAVSLHSALKPPADLVVIQQMWLVLQHDAIQNLDHGVEIFVGIVAECFDAAFVVAGRTATFLGRAITLAADTGRIALAGLWFMAGFDSRFVLPVISHVVCVNELRPAAEIEAAKRSIRSFGSQLPGAVMHGVDAKLIKVKAAPPR